MTDTYPPDHPGRMLLLPSPGATLTRYAEETALRQYIAPLPLLFELYRRHPSPLTELPMLVASGVAWPYGAGAAVRVATSPANTLQPMRVPRLGLYSSIGEVLVEYGGRDGDALVVYREPTITLDQHAPAYGNRAEAFAAMAPGPDLVGWGVWWPEADGAVLHTPERTQFGGAQQRPRTAWYPSLRHLDADLPTDHDGRHRVRWLATGSGRRLAEQVRREHADRMRRAEQAIEHAKQAVGVNPITALPT